MYHFSKFTKVAISAVLFALPSIAYAAPQMTTVVYVHSVHVKENVVDVQTDYHSNPMGCKINNFVRIRKAQYPNADTMAAAAMTAFSLNARIAAWINECDSDGMPIAATINLQK